MRRWKAFLVGLAATAVVIVGVAALTPAALAQVAATLMRDVDGPSGSVVRAAKVLTFASDATMTARARLYAVPRGQRLVIDSISWHSEASAEAGAEIFRGFLRASAVGANVAELSIGPARHVRRVLDSFYDPNVQDGAQQGPLYFEPGEEVWVEMQHNLTTKPRLIPTEVRVMIHARLLTL